MNTYSRYLKTIGTIVMFPGLVMFALFQLSGASTSLSPAVEGVLEKAMYAGLLIFLISLWPEAKTPWQRVCVGIVVLFGVLALFAVLQGQ